MVLRQLVHLTPTNEVDAAVADVSDERTLPGDEEHRCGRGHAFLLQLRLGSLEDCGRSALHRSGQQLLDLRTELRRRMRRHLLEQRRLRADARPDVLDRNGAGHFARGMPTHAVGDDVQSEAAVDQEAVLVGGTSRTDVGASESPGLHRYLPHERCGGENDRWGLCIRGRKALSTARRPARSTV
jgi:hypothetical protein